MTDVIKTGQKVWSNTKKTIENQHPVVEIGVGATMILLTLPIPVIDPVDLAGIGLIAHGVKRLSDDL